MNKKYLSPIFVILLLIPFISQVYAVPAYIIDGDTVYINDANAYIAAYPHTIDVSQYVYLDIISKKYSGEIDICFGFNTELMRPRSLDLLTPSGWTSISSIFNKITYNFQGMNTWYYAKHIFIKAQEYNTRFFLDVLPYEGETIYKYFIALKPSSETIAEANANGHLYVLDPWLAGGYDYRVLLSIDSGDVGEVLTNYPLLVEISTSAGINDEDVSFIFDELEDEDQKIAFTTSDELTQIYAEVDSWNNVTEVAYIWVKVPSIATGADTDIYMYYDKDVADNVNFIGDDEDDAATNAVWSSEFKGVWHLKDVTTSTIKDSTSNNNDGTKLDANEPLEVSTGKIDDAQEYDATDDEIDCGTDASLNITTTITIQLWVYPYTTGISSITAKRKTGVDDAWMIDQWAAGSVAFLIWDGAEKVHQTAANVLTNDTWNHIVCTYDGLKLRVYVNGTYISGLAHIGDIDSTPTVPVYIGTNGYTSHWDGRIDEERVKQGNSTTAWISSTYENERDHFIDWGTEEERPRTTVTHSTTVTTTQYTTSYTTSCGSYYSTEYSTTTSTVTCDTTTVFSTTSLETIISIDETISVDETVSESVDETIVVASTSTTSVTVYTTFATTSITSQTSTWTEHAAYGLTTTSSLARTTATGTTSILTTITSGTTYEIVSEVQTLLETILGGESVFVMLKGSSASSALASAFTILLVALPLLIVLIFILRRRRR